MLRVPLPPSAFPGRYPAAVRGRRFVVAGFSPAVRSPRPLSAAVRGRRFGVGGYSPPSASPAATLRPRGGAGVVLRAGRLLRWRLAALGG
jgi:hypothetical protein